MTKQSRMPRKGTALAWAIFCCSLVASATSTANANDSAQPVDYLRQIKPILRERCFACHGALKQESNLRLDAASLLKTGGDSGAAIVPGKPGDSLLIERVTAADESYRMPPEGEPLSAEQIALLSAWIEQGAAAPEDEKPEADPREHWSFKVPQRPPLPALENAGASSNPIDRFLAAAHQQHGLVAAPPVDKSLLLRRVYLDLVGVPPTRDELHDFLADDSPDAFERVVDRLLNSPQYGERWGRHWMDVWRYSDWYGRRMVPDVWNSAPQIWRWRDWIVRSLNDDKGYDRMIMEMLAGDEIAPEDPDIAAATGYLVRNWYALNPNDWMRSNVEHTAKAFLALTFNCAHCHDHKYDPIAQDDYFRLRAFFEPIGIRQDRVAGEADPGVFQEYEYSTLRKVNRLGMVRIYDKNADAPTWFYTAGDERNRVEERGSLPPGVPSFLHDLPTAVATINLPARAWYPGLQPAIQDTIRAELRAAAEQAQHALSQVDTETSEANPLEVEAAQLKLAAANAALASLEVRIAADRAANGETSGADVSSLALAASLLERQTAVKAAEAQVAAAKKTLADAEAKPEGAEKRAEGIDAANKQLAAATEALTAANVALADTSSSAEYTPLSPKFPQESTGRRRALAAWIADANNPLTARVAINHIWMRHFHAPLVATVFDFGNNGARPTHPELLDWLAVELVESGWSMKHIHRLIVTSQAYRMSSATPPGSPSLSIDPENKYLWRMNAGRMQAEVIRDSLLASAGALDLQMQGQELENSEALTTRRRSLYYSCHPEESGKSEFGRLFDAPDAGECYRRTRSIVPQQALALTNSDLVHAMSAALAAELQAQVVQVLSDDPTADSQSIFITAAYERVLTRQPSEEELRLCNEFLAQQTALFAETDSETASAEACEALVRVLLNHNDFLTIR